MENIIKKRPCEFDVMNGSGKRIKDGLFHQWGVDFYETHDETFQWTIGIVEGPDGQIHKVDPGSIRFKDK